MDRMRISVGKILLLMFWPLSLTMTWAATAKPQWIEVYYTQGFSKFCSRFLSMTTGVIPFSLAELMVWTLILALIMFLFRQIWGLLFKAKRISPNGFLSWVYRGLAVLGIVYFAFISLWGLNYYRSSFAEIAGFSVGHATNKDLALLCEKLIFSANDLRKVLKEDEQGVVTLEGGFTAIKNKAPDAFSNAAGVYPQLGGAYGKPKPVFFSRYMSYTGISGVYFPFTGEANVNIDIPESMLPATTCHEMAHQRGFAREDEANYIAWVTCRSSEDSYFQYSGTILALIYSMNALYDNAPEEAARLNRQYGEGLRRDLRAIREYWRQFEGKAEEIMSDVNDAYLKSNRQEEGVKSYGRMVDLLLAEQEAQASQKFL